MPSVRHAALSRTPLLLAIGFFVGAVFTTSMKLSGNHDVSETYPRSSTVIGGGSQIEHSDDLDASAFVSRAVSRLRFPRNGVPAPDEAALRFAAANEAGSDKVSLHSYHLMYGPFLAPHLQKNVVSVDAK